MGFGSGMRGWVLDFWFGMRSEFDLLGGHVDARKVPPRVKFVRVLEHEAERVPVQGYFDHKKTPSSAMLQ